MTTTPTAAYCDTAFTFCCNDLPDDKNAPIPADLNLGHDWKAVSLRKDGGQPVKYIQELSTGDLYQYEPLNKLATKSFGIMLGTPFYTAGMMITNLIRVVVDVCRLVWKIFADFGSIWKEKGGVAAFAHVFSTLLFELPVAVTHDLWRVVRSPFYGIGLFFAAFYGTFAPLEGRKWIAKVENGWHEGASFRNDVRYHGGCLQACENFQVSKMWENFNANSVFYLGYCMQVRGNINEKTAGANRFIP